MNYRACCWAAAATARPGRRGLHARHRHRSRARGDGVRSQRQAAAGVRAVVPGPRSGDRQDRPGASRGSTSPPTAAPSRRWRGRSASSTSTWNRWTAFPPWPRARTPVSGPVDLPTATVPANVAVIDGSPSSRSTRWRSATTPPLATWSLRPSRSWPTGGSSGSACAATTPASGCRASRWWPRRSYNLLKRDDSLTCGPTTAATIPDSCGYLELLAQQMSPEMARASLVQLEGLRAVFTLPQVGGGGWASLEAGRHPQGAGGGAVGVPGAFQPGDRSLPAGGLVPQPAGANEIRLAVNGTLDPATVTPLRVAQSVGTVMLVNLDALAEPMSTGGFPAVHRQLRRGDDQHHRHRPAAGGQAIRHPGHPRGQGPAGPGAGAAADLGAADGARSAGGSGHHEEHGLQHRRRRGDATGGRAARGWRRCSTTPVSRR